MRRVRRISDQHAIAVVPTLAEHALEGEPGGSAQVRGVAHELVALEVLRKQLSREGDRLFVIGAIEAVREPGFLARLDDDR